MTRYILLFPSLNYENNIDVYEIKSETFKVVVMKKKRFRL